MLSNKMSEEIKDSKTTDGISDADMKSLARTLLPILLWSKNNSKMQRIILERMQKTF